MPDDYDGAPDPMYEEKARELDDAAAGRCEPIDEPIDAEPPGAEVVAIDAVAEVIEIVNPATGQAIDLNATTDVVAGALDDVRALEGRLRDYKSELTKELLRRMDYARTWAAHLRGFGKVSGDAPRAPDYDGKILRSRLMALVPEVLSKEAVDEAVELVMEHKVKKVGVNNLLKVPDERVADALVAAAVQNTKPRAVRIERAKREPS